jgi:DNA-binding MarR family transcriptional regulator
MQKTKASQAFTELILDVFRLNGRLLSAGDALTRPVGQTSARWQILGSLDEGPRTVADIGRRMGLTRQSVQRTADLLESDGLLSYVDNPGHRRAKLTPRGETTLNAITGRQIEWANRVANRLAEADLQNAIRTLQQVRESLEHSAVSQEPTAGRPRFWGTFPRTTRKKKRGRAS